MGLPLKREGMEKIVVDTDIIIDYLGGARTAAAFLESIDPQFRSTTTVNCMEVLQGARNSTESRKLDTFLNATFEILPLTPKSCATALDLIRRHALPSGLRTGDALIAAVAIENEARLATGNSRHFRDIKGLAIIPHRKTIAD